MTTGPGALLSEQELLERADYEAALRCHPYLGPEHVALAAAQVRGDRSTYARLSAELPDGPRRRGILNWRPRGPRSMARRPGRRRLLAEQAAARRERRHDFWSGTDTAAHP